MPEDQKKIERRVRESWRAYACAAGLCTGAQVFLFGTGVAMPVALGSAWMAALAALLWIALVTAACRKHLASERRMTRGRAVLLALTLLLCAVSGAAALVELAAQTLLEQTPVLWSAAVTAAAVCLCALCGEGVPRLCFALRYALPVLMIALTLLCVPVQAPAGIFPILGNGLPALAAAALGMLGAAAPAVMLLVPPQDAVLAGEYAVPETGFFVKRVLAGAGTGVLLVLAACAGATYESIASSGAWGERLRIAASAHPHEGLAATMLALLQMTAIALLAANMLSAGARALGYAFSGGRGDCAAPAAPPSLPLFLPLFLLLFALLFALVFFGFELAVVSGPLLVVPVALLLLPGRKRKADSP